MSQVVMFSGGITSWAVAKLVIDRCGTGDVTLLFADTKAEHEDNYRFNRDAEKQLGVPITVVTDGRTPQQVNRDVRWLGNTKIAPCSHHLKQIPCRKWLEANTDPADTVVYVGIDWSEMHRLPSIERNWKPWPVRAPLTEPPYRDKRYWLDDARRLGLEPPAMYRQGFQHANCGGACVRGGQAQWAHLLRVNPALYASWEQHEQDMRTLLDSNIAVLRDRTNGTTKPLPLTVLRKRIEGEQDGFDQLDWGGCGCFTDIGDAA